jgi:hypothetical protein
MAQSSWAVAARRVPRGPGAACAFTRLVRRERHSRDKTVEAGKRRASYLAAWSVE